MRKFLLRIDEADIAISIDMAEAPQIGQTLSFKIVPLTGSYVVEDIDTRIAGPGQCFMHAGVSHEQTSEVLVLKRKQKNWLISV